MTVNVSVVYHSGYGHTAKVAEAISKGVKSAGANVSLIEITSMNDEKWLTLDNSQAIIFGAPTYMGSVSGSFKMFMDATSKQWMEKKWKDKIAAGFTNSGSYSGDKLASIQQIFHLAMQHSMIWVGQAESAPMLGDNELPQLDAINRIGSWSGLMTQANQKSGADISPPKGDLDTAELFGQRIVAICNRYK